jgi:hypothetical protein
MNVIKKWSNQILKIILKFLYYYIIQNIGSNSVLLAMSIKVSIDELCKKYKKLNEPVVYD